MIWSAWGPPSFPFPLTRVREQSAERRYVLVCTLRCRVPCGHAASRRSTCGVFHPGTVLPGPDRGIESPRVHTAFAAFVPDRVQPSKAALHSKDGRKTQGDPDLLCAYTGARAPRLLRQP